MPVRYISHKDIGLKNLSDGDIVVEVSGGSPVQSTGRTIIITDSLLKRYNGRMVCSNFCKVLRPFQGYSAFTYYYLKYLYDHDIFFSYENGTTGIKNLNVKKFIETEPIYIPPIDDIAFFNGAFKVMHEDICARNNENEYLSQIRDNLIPKLMSGELNVLELDI